MQIANIADIFLLSINEDNYILFSFVGDASVNFVNEHSWQLFQYAIGVYCVFAHLISNRVYILVWIMRNVTSFDGYVFKVNVLMVLGYDYFELCSSFTR